MDGRKAGCLLVALVTVVCIQQAGVVLSVLGKKRENRLKKTKRHQTTTRGDKDTRSRSQKVCYTNGNKVRNTSERKDSRVRPTVRVGVQNGY